MKKGKYIHFLELLSHFLPPKYPFCVISHILTPSVVAVETPFLSPEALRTHSVGTLLEAEQMHSAEHVSDETNTNAIVIRERKISK